MAVAVVRLVPLACAEVHFTCTAWGAIRPFDPFFRLFFFTD